MDGSSSEFIQKLWSFIFKNKLVVVLSLVGLIFLSAGLIEYFGSKRQNIELIEGSDTSSKSHASEIAVDVSGEVLHPDVYHLPADSRIQDALIAAGGLSALADREYISKYINLAQKITDGAKIYIPSLNDESPSYDRSSKNSLININTASSSVLEGLSGIGPVTAEKIIDGRPYFSLEDLVTKKALSKKVFEKIQAELSLY